MSNPFMHDRRRAMTSGRVAQIFARCDGRCGTCRRKFRAAEDYEVDHIIPLSGGGTDDDDNLQILCPGCHLIKTGGDVSDAAKGKRRYVKHVVPKRFRQSKGWRR